ncbi:MAG TPA: hypothetical protein VGV62_06595 [Xanthobacteraceae bacterium]|nr:hypothetical protein [Xanthobacteraceae bacterium]
MLKLLLIAAALSVVPAPILAQITIVDIPTKVVPTKVGSKSDLDNLECRSEDTLGSRLERHQVCMTKQQWWSYELEAKNRVYDWQRIGFNVSH